MAHPELIDSKAVRKHVVDHRAAWTARKRALRCDKALLKKRAAVNTVLKGCANAVVVAVNKDPRSTVQIETCVGMLTIECKVMQAEIRFLTFVYNARKRKPADIAAAAAALASLHELRVTALEAITEADVSGDTKLVAVVASATGTPSLHENGGGVKIIADRYMERYRWETRVMGMCRAGQYMVYCQ